ncbi:MAG: class I tRNA ligase family protein, partial [Candidatus Peregrinibacteria bacterium]|nr:class I tRNA ligase family protein [Candidatus Peregrinibacteria bacterium]
YYLRYMDNNNEQEFCSKEAEEFWGPVDLYVGGAEHAVLHLLYSRFWHKVLFDLGLVSTKEPFKKLVNTGLIMAEDGVKMSKSLGNVVNPDEMIEKFGADSLRVYEMFMGPFEQSKAWNEKTLSGTRKFLDRVWRVFEKPVTDKENKDLLPVLHKTIKVVSEHIDDFKFNTAIAQMMVLVNELTALKEVPRNVLEDFAVLLAPFAPHLAEEFWKNLGHKGTIAFVAWPKYDESLLVEDSVKYAVQVNGKLRADFEISKDALKEEAIAMAKSLDSVQKWIDGKEIVKEIFVPGKIVGFVVRD